MNIESLSLNSGEVQPIRVIAGFWQRLFAFVIDEIIICIPCYIIGYAFFDFFSRSLVWGFLAGAVITLPYFAILGSAFGSGQTPGLRFNHLRVVDKEGRPLTIGRSILRYLILLLPFTDTSAVLPARTPSMVQGAVDWLVFAATFAIVYLYVFNGNTRQSLHDIATGSYVVSAGHSGKIEVAPLWKVHWAILAGMMFFIAAIGYVFDEKSKQWDSFAEATSIQESVLSSGKVQSASVTAQTNWINGSKTTGIVVTVTWKGTPINYEEAAAEIAGIVLNADTKASARDFISVALVREFHVGLAEMHKSWSDSHSPMQWKDKILK